MLNVRKSTKPASNSTPATTPKPKATPATEETMSNPDIILDNPVTPMSSGVRVAAGIPLPPSRGGASGVRYPWETLAIGESFFVAGAKIATFYTATSSASKKHGRKFTARKVADGSPWGATGAGVAVWRVE